MNKYNKSEDRAIMITEKMIFKLDPAKRYKAMTSGIPLSKVNFTNCFLIAFLLIYLPYCINQETAK